MMKKAAKKYQKLIILASLSLIATFIYHNWLPNHKIEFSHSYLLHFLTDSFFTGVLFFITWEGNSRVALWLDRRFKWEENPVKRLLLQISLNTSHSFLLITASIVLYSFIISRFIPEHERLQQTSGAYPVLRSASYLLLALFLLYQVTYLGIYFFRQWSNSLLESERLKRENLSSQLQALQVQVNPHFLFNSLSSLVSLIEEDKELAIEFVEELASVYRYLLQQKSEHLVSLCDEMKFIESYIYLHKARCGESLRTEIDIDNKFMDYLIPPQTVQILAENAIKHNIISMQKPLTIKVYVDKEGLLTVENNLQKKVSTLKHTGTGLKNITDRYRLLGKDAIRVRESESIFQVKVPLINYREADESFDS
ncbi:MAG: sensor histidine kinase [Bacillota bacterium]